MFLTNVVVPQDRLSVESERLLTKIAQSESPHIPQDVKDWARNKVIVTVSGLAMKTAVAAAKGDPEKAYDYYQEAMMVLARKFYKFNLSYGVRYISYAGHWISQAIRRYRIMKTNIISVPIGHYDNSTGNASSRKKFLGRSTTALQCVSFQARSHFYQRKTGSKPIADDEQIVSKMPDPSAAATTAELVKFVHDNLSKLGSRDHGVLLDRMAGKPLREIGASLGVSGERIRQIEFQAMENLRFLVANSKSPPVDWDTGRVSGFSKKRLVYEQVRDVIRKAGPDCFYEQIRDILGWNSGRLTVKVFGRLKSSVFGKRGKHARRKRGKRLRAEAAS